MKSFELYNDELYGPWRVPEIVELLAISQSMIRIKNVAQSTLPVQFTPQWRIPSRFEHSMGVARLAMAVINTTDVPDDMIYTLIAAAVLHDAGSPPFSHLSEPFLIDMTGHNGESYLGGCFEDDTLKWVLRKYGVRSEDVLALVCGKNMPFSDILHGTMDIDNLDNIARFWKGLNAGEVGYDPHRIACNFKWNGSEWTLSSDMIKEVREWKRARSVLYGDHIYGDRHLTINQMVWRAVQLAYSRGEIPRRFFDLNDDQGVDWLLKYCNPESRYLVLQAINQKPYVLVYDRSMPAITGTAKKYEDDKFARVWLADTVSQAIGGLQSGVCALMSKGRDKRRLNLKFVDKNNNAVDLNEEDDEQIWRIKIWLSPEMQHHRDAVRICVDSLLA